MRPSLKHALWTARSRIGPYRPVASLGKGEFAQMWLAKDIFGDV